MSMTESLTHQQVWGLEIGDEVCVIVEVRNAASAVAIAEVVCEPYAWGGNPGNPAVNVKVNEYKTETKLRHADGSEFEVGAELPVGVGQLFDVSAAD